MKRIASKINNLKRVFLIPFALVVLLLASCEKNLDLQPYDQISEKVAFSSPSLIALSVTGMYEAAQRGYYNGGYRGYPFGAAFVEQGDCRGEDAVSTGTFYKKTYTNVYSPTTANNVYYWSDTYRLINRCNIVIEGVRDAAENGIISDSLANEYEAEARLLRAMSYHELLVFFARPYKDTEDASHLGVPYHDKAIINQTAINQAFETGRSTVAEVYTHILADLEYAEENLPVKSERIGNAQITRGTKGAAVAEKTRIYLHMWNMDKVIEEGQKFITGNLAGSYSITNNPSEPFTSPYSNDESILGMENSESSNPGINGALAVMLGSRKLVAISPIIWRDAAWLADDKRRAEDEMITTEGGVKYTNKYKDRLGYSDPSPMIRYAEVLLNMAEAYARKNNVGNGLKYLNMVRDRALASAATQAYTASSFTDNIALLGAILKERRIEFVLEGKRWSDIHRLQQCPYFPINGIPTKLDNTFPSASVYTLGTPYNGPYAIAAIPYSDYRFLWPIPQNEINANPILADQQNPGW